MTLHTTNECSAAPSQEVAALATTVITAVLREEGWPEDVSVDLTLVDDAAIREINREFRGIDAPTDVLSFPFLPADGPLSASSVERNAGNTDPDSGDLLLGDVVLSLERAEAQAREYGHSLKREIAFLLAHSALHLLGYDHVRPEDAAVMEAKQEKILADLGIHRE